MNGGIDLKCRQQRIRIIRCAPNQPVKRITEPYTDHIKGEPENQSHDGNEGRNGCVFARQHFIDLKAANVFTTHTWFYHRLATDLINK